MKTILIVDDNVALLRACTQALRADYVVHAAPDTASAKLYFQDRNIDLAAIDIVLPESESGVDLARDLRAIRSVPILAISAYVTAEIMHIIPTVFDGFLAKPFTAPELRQALLDVQDKFRFSAVES